MNFKFLTLFAAALTVGFNSCSNEGEGIDPVEAGVDTKFSLTIATPATYATDANATTPELTINTVDVFVYNKSGALETYANKPWSAFDPATGKLLDTEKIDTKTGTKTIFVGINLPTTVVNTIKANGADAAISIASIADLKSNGFAMFSTEAVEKALLEDASKNSVTVKVARLVAKVAFFKEATLNVSGGAKVKDLMFTTGNVNNEYYPLPYGNYADPNFASADKTAVFYHPGSKVDAYKSINAKGTEILTSNVVYAAENTVEDDNVVQGALTYGIVQLTYTPARTVTLSNPADGNSDLVANNTPSEGATFYLVRVSNSGVITNYFFSNKTHAETFAVAKGSTIDKVVTYTNGKMYYSVFLKGGKKGDASEFSVYRNTIYRVTVTGINGIGSYTDQPLPTDPLIPGIIDPIDPPVIEGDDTSITVNVEIVDWSLVPVQNEDLQGK